MGVTGQYKDTNYRINKKPELLDQVRPNTIVSEFKEAYVNLTNYVRHSKIKSMGLYLLFSFTVL